MVRTGSLGRFASWVDALPRESAYQRALDPNSHWTIDTELAASIAEKLATTNVLLWSGFPFKRGSGMPRPLHIRRPWDEPESQPSLQQRIRSALL